MNMNMNTNDDDEDVFYEAEENILPNLNKLKNEDSPFVIRKDTIYEDVDDISDLPKLNHNFESENLTIRKSVNDMRNSFFSSVKTNQFEKKEREKEKSRKLEMLSEDLKDINLDLEFLKKNLKIINVKNKGIKEKHLQNLFELQNFEGDSQQIWACKISFDGKYLATGGKSGVLKIWEIYNEEDSIDNYEFKGIISFFKLINETAFRIYTEHSQDIIDICWNTKNYSLLLTASLDHNVILWDVNQEISINSFAHSAMVSTVSFSPISEENIFVSGCFDKIVRIWNLMKNKVVDYINVQDYIISVAFFPTGDLIIVGSHTGKCSIYEWNPKLKYCYSFDCKNKSGKYSDGRKITNIEFLNKNNVLVTTNDSSIRLVNVNDGKILQKYKGLLNDEYMIRAAFEEIYDLVISASDDGFVYIWKKLNPVSTNSIKNKTYEYFKAFEKENSTCSLFINDISLSAYIKKIMRITVKFFIKSIIINTSNTGRIQILINAEN